MLETLLLKLRNVPQNPETVFEPFSQDMTRLLGDDLAGVAVYGSAASGDYVIDVFVDGHSFAGAGDGYPQILALAVVPLHRVFQCERKDVLKMVLDELQEAVQSERRPARGNSINEFVLSGWLQELGHGIGEGGNFRHIQIQQLFQEAALQ